MKKNMLLAMSLFVIAGLVLAACGGGATETPKVELTLWHAYQTGSAEEATLGKLIENAKAKYLGKAGELTALSSATVIDFYRRHFVKQATDTHYLRVSKAATIVWGLFACVVAMYASDQGSLIEVVNRYGSFFYGSLLGVFILAVLTKRATATGAFVGLIAGMAVVLVVAFTTPIAFLWHNLIGAVVVVVVGLVISAVKPSPGAVSGGGCQFFSSSSS